MPEYRLDAVRGAKKRRKSPGLLLPEQMKIMRNIRLGTLRSSEALVRRLEAEEASCDKGQLEAVDDPIHHSIVCDGGDDARLIF